MVVIDPAHGGSDSGARGSSGAVESELVLDFARVLRIALESQGLRVLLTREGNQDPSFDDRSAMVNSLREAVFISLHVSSTGPAGTARAYSLVFPAAASPSALLNADSPRGESAGGAPAPSRNGLQQWRRAQFPYLSASRRLAELMQIQLAQKFKGSPETPLAASILQLRSIAAPAVAVEVSSVAAADPPRFAQMAQPLADAISRAVADYRAALAALPAGTAPGAR